MFSDRISRNSDSCLNTPIYGIKYFRCQRKTKIFIFLIIFPKWFNRIEVHGCSVLSAWEGTAKSKTIGMNRRNLIKALGLSAVGLATVPLWVDSWSASTLPTEGLAMPEDLRDLFSELVGAIIPPTDIPGARELEVDKFILVMLEDCFDADTQKKFIAGLEGFGKMTQESYSTSFPELSVQEQADLLVKMEAAEDIPQGTGAESDFQFVSFTKRLTIRGFMSSEYIMKNILNYELVPSRFHGSFPVEQSNYRNA